jgi:hypothetical protein
MRPLLNTWGAIACISMLLLGDMSANAASQAFDESFQRLVAGYVNELRGDPNDKLFEEIFSKGTKQDLANSIRIGLSDSTQVERWHKLLQLSSSADIAPRELLPWMRANLKTVLSSCDLAAAFFVHNILSYGNDGDAQAVLDVAKSLPPDRAELARKVASRIRDSIQLTSQLSPPTSQGGSSVPSSHEQKSSSTKPRPTPKPPSTAPVPSTPSEEPPSSTPWSVVAVLIVAACGLLWLLVKNRK